MNVSILFLAILCLWGAVCGTEAENQGLRAENVPL